jgi:hypothetical protein
MTKAIPSLLNPYVFFINTCYNDFAGKIIKCDE